MTIPSPLLLNCTPLSLSRMHQLHPQRHCITPPLSLACPSRTSPARSPFPLLSPTATRHHRQRMPLSRCLQPYELLANAPSTSIKRALTLSFRTRHSSTSATLPVASLLASVCNATSALTSTSVVAVIHELHRACGSPALDAASLASRPSSPSRATPACPRPCQRPCEPLRSHLLSNADHVTAFASSILIMLVHA